MWIKLIQFVNCVIRTLRGKTLKTFVLVTFLNQHYSVKDSAETAEAKFKRKQNLKLAKRKLKNKSKRLQQISLYQQHNRFSPRKM